MLELIARAKANPGRLNYGAGIITTRLAGYLFNREAGIDVQYIPFQGSPPTVQGLLTGAVGEGAGVEFLSWLANADLPDPERVLADPDSFELPERSDRAFAVLTAVAAVAVSHGDAETWAAAWRVVAKAARTAPDVATLVARTLASARPAGAALPIEVLELIPVLRAAGLMPEESGR